MVQVRKGLPVAGREQLTDFRLILVTAFCTPRTEYSWQPSRSSTASCAPVEAPDGAEVTDTVPSAAVSQTLTVGYPRESWICRARTPVI